MAAIKAKDTGPEIKVRKTLYSLGYRYRLQSDKLPGKPDIVFKGRKKVIFINGCFWHAHGCAKGNRIPKSNQEYWAKKIARNVERDERNLSELKNLGWTATSIWECEIKNDENLRSRLIEFLGEA